VNRSRLKVYPLSIKVDCDLRRRLGEGESIFDESTSHVPMRLL
jgi:hypothetical protein